MGKEKGAVRLSDREDLKRMLEVSKQNDFKESPDELKQLTIFDTGKEKSKRKRHR